MSRWVETVNCDEVSELLEGFVDGELGPAENESVMAHLAECTSCADEHRFALEIQTRLRTLPLVEPPENVVSEVERVTSVGQGIGPRVFASIGRVRKNPRVAAVVAVAAAVVLVVVLTPWGRGPKEDASRLEAEKAAAEARLALAYVADITRRGERAARVRVVQGEAVAKTLRGVARSINWTGEVEGAPPSPSQTPEKNTKRSLS